MRWTAMLCAVALAVTARGDRFRHRMSGEQVEGQLLTVAEVEGRRLYVVKEGEAVRRLAAEEWERVAGPKVATARAPATAAPAAPKVAPFQWPEIRYGGVVRTEEWLERAYKALADQLVVCGGAAVNRQRIWRLGDGNAAVGTIFTSECRVSRVLEKGRIVASLDNYQQVVIDGLDTTHLADGQKWRATLAAVGTEKMGYGGTLLRCVVVPDPAPLPTREEFAAALQAGVALYSFRRCERCLGYGYVYVQKWRTSGMSRESYQAKAGCPACGGRKGRRVDLARE